MKVKIEIIPECQETYAVIYTQEVTEDVQRLVDSFHQKISPVIALANDNIRILQPKDVYMVKVENGETLIYDKTNQYYSRKRLYELKEQLGNTFMQISKNSLVNLNELDRVEPGFSGTLLLFLKNGCKDYVSRKYLPDFKRYLGL